VTDELIAFGHSQTWQAALLTLSQTCAQQALEDAASFDAAYDQGAFDDQ
jgi:hypothetical protein